MNHFTDDLIRKMTLGDVLTARDMTQAILDEILDGGFPDQDSFESIIHVLDNVLLRHGVADSIVNPTK